MKFAAYFQTWSSKWNSYAPSLDLVDVPDEVSIIYLAFLKPNCSYEKGYCNFTGTGLEFSSDFKVVKEAIDILRKKGKVVMLSLGGATYPFTGYDVDSVVNLAHDLGVDGIDLDWEPSTGSAASGELSNIISDFKAKMGELKLCLTGFSVGCYGVGKFKDSQPKGMYTGMNIIGLKDKGHLLDWVNIMSYDAGPTYKPIEAIKRLSILNRKSHNPKVEDTAKEIANKNGITLISKHMNYTFNRKDDSMVRDLINYMKDISNIKKTKRGFLDYIGSHYSGGQYSHFWSAANNAGIIEKVGGGNNVTYKLGSNYENWENNKVVAF